MPYNTIHRLCSILYAQYSIFSTLCSVLNVQYFMFSTLFFSILCSVLNVQYFMFSTLCSVGLLCVQYLCPVLCGTAFYVQVRYSMFSTL